MASPPNPTRRVARAARSGVVGTVVVAVAFFDGVFVGVPIALLTASVGSPLVFVAATIAVICLVIGCCSWVDRRWDDWLSGNGKRIETTFEKMRASRLMTRPVAWIERGSNRQYALAAALANPILVAAFARSLTGQPVGERRILAGAVAYAVPYVAMQSIAGFVLGEAIRAA
jgi:hypothetical protein